MSDSPFIPCIPKHLPPAQQITAAEVATELFAGNAPPALEYLIGLLPPDVIKPYHLAVLTQKMWPASGVNLTVGFMEQTTQGFRDKFFLYANKWGKTANVKLRYSTTDPTIRVTLQQDGYWSYIGTDNLHIPRNQPTMCLSRFSTSIPDAEWDRVVTHEVGHALGFPHEQFLPQIVEMLDRDKVIPWAMKTTGWSREEVIAQMLTPLKPGSYRMSANANVNGCMMYPFPASVTKNGKPIPGGTGIDDLDYAFVATIYPKTDAPVTPTDPTQPPVTPPVPGGKMTKTELLNYLTNGAATLNRLVTALARLPSWLRGLLPTWLVTPVTSLAAFLTFLASDPTVDLGIVKISVLDILLSAISKAGYTLSASDMPTPAQLAEMAPANLDAAAKALPPVSP